MDFTDILTESRGEGGMGSKQGREKFVQGQTKDRSAKSSKSKVRIYPSISKALARSHHGDIFSTKSANRLYVTTKPTWGEKSKAKGNDKVAKGFTPGSATPGAGWDEIKKYAERTKQKHGSKHTDENYNTFRRVIKSCY